MLLRLKSTCLTRLEEKWTKLVARSIVHNCDKGETIEKVNKDFMETSEENATRVAEAESTVESVDYIDCC